MKANSFTPTNILKKLSREIYRIIRFYRQVSQLTWSSVTENGRFLTKRVLLSLSPSSSSSSSGSSSRSSDFAFLAGVVFTSPLFARFFVGLSVSISSSELDSSSPELLDSSFFAAAFLAGAAFFAGFSSSSLDDSSEEDSSFFAGAFLAGAAFLGGDFFAGASSSLEDSSEDDSSFLGAGAFLAGAAFLGGDFLAGASSSLEESSEEEDSFLAAGFLAAAFLTGVSEIRKLIFCRNYRNDYLNFYFIKWHQNVRQYLTFSGCGGLFF